MARTVTQQCTPPLVSASSATGAAPSRNRPRHSEPAVSWASDAGLLRLCIEDEQVDDWRSGGRGDRQGDGGVAGAGDRQDAVAQRAGLDPVTRAVPVRTAVVSPRVTCCRTGTPTGWPKMFAELHAYAAGAGAGERGGDRRGGDREEATGEDTGCDGCAPNCAEVRVAQPAVNVMAARASRHRTRGTLDRRGRSVVGCLPMRFLNIGTCKATTTGR